MPVTTATVDQMNAANVPNDTSVSMVDEPCRALFSAALWKGNPPQNTIGAVSAMTSHSQPGKCQAITIDSASTGTARTADPIRRGRNCSVGTSWFM